MPLPPYIHEKLKDKVLDFDHHRTFTAEKYTKHPFINVIVEDEFDERNLTIVMTTHDVNIMDAADHIFTMEDGVIVDVK